VVNEGFPLQLQLRADKIKINEVLKPMHIIVLEDFIVVQNEYLPKEKCFFIYEKKRHRFCFSFGQLGQSGTNDEFVAPVPIEDCRGNMLQIFDQASRRIHSYQISEAKATLLKQEKLKDDNGFLPLQHISHVNDSVLIFLTHQMELCTYSLASAEYIDRIKFKTDVPSKVEKYNQNLDYFALCNSNSKIAIGFHFINIVQQGRLDDNFHFKFKTLEISSNETFQPKLHNNIFYYGFIKASDKYIFAGNFGYQFLSFQPFPVNWGKRYFKPHVEVYDWDMNKVASLQLDNDIVSCAVDEKQKVIYTWNPQDDFDYLLAYKYDF
jgi:hypothetical protein